MIAISIDLLWGKLPLFAKVYLQYRVQLTSTVSESTMVKGMMYIYFLLKNPLAGPVNIFGEGYFGPYSLIILIFTYDHKINTVGLHQYNYHLSFSFITIY